MNKFALSNRDFESIKAQVSGTETVLEIIKLDNTNYGIFEHNGDLVEEVGCYTKAELKLIWQMLTEK